MRVRFKRIPTYSFETNTWSQTTFSNQEEFAEFLQSIFKEPGEYDFDVSTLKWNEHAKHFKKNGYYTEAIEGSYDFITYYETEKRKCRSGVIWKHRDKTWFIPGDYYLLLNFLPVPSNKEQGQNDAFCSVRDVQYQMANYDKIAEALHKHAVILKRRQCMSSNYHMAKFICVYWFEKTKKLKLLAYKDDYVSGPQGSWNILESFRDFLNQNTGWNRPSNPSEVGNWEQKESRTDAKKRRSFYGRKSSIIAKTLNKNYKGGIGGPTYYVFYEEAGVAPEMDKTLQFLNPAMESGNELVGMFMAAGSVGDLKECKPLEKFIKNPDPYRMYKVPTRWYDSTGVIKECGLFIPAQYGMPQFVDEFGNSQVDLALAELRRLDQEYKKTLSTYEYNVWKSQNPLTIEEAFNFREDLYFPVDLITRRQAVIKLKQERGEFKAKRGVLKEDDNGRVKFIPLSEIKTNIPVEMEYPIDPKADDKRGIVTIYEDPPDNPEFLTYFGGVDTTEANITSTSDSVFTVDIVKRSVRRIWYEDGVRHERLEGRRLVATYRGRYDDNEDTNKQGELLIRLYNAFAAVERNKPNFINHMRRIKKSKHLMKRKDLTLFKDVDTTALENDEYGIWFGQDNKAEGILNEQIKDNLESVLDVVYKKDKDGNQLEEVLKKHRGIDDIDDYWLLEELKLWYHGLNTDRRVSYGLAVIAANCYEMTYQKIIETKPKEEIKNRITRPISLLGSSRTSRKTNKRTRSLI